MKRILCGLIFTALAFPAFAREKRGSHPELCRIRTVYVAGNSESANKVRAEIEKRTWLALVASKDGADAVLDVAETKSTRGFPVMMEQTTVSAQFVNGSGELLWSASESWSEGPFNSGAGSGAKLLLNDLKNAGNCSEHIHTGGAER